MTTLKDRIRLVRTEAGLNLREFAEIVDVSIATISSWERGKNKPRARLLSQLARNTIQTTEWLLTGVTAFNENWLDQLTDPKNRCKAITKPVINRLNRKETVLKLQDKVEQQAIVIRNYLNKISTYKTVIYDLNIAHDGLMRELVIKSTDTHSSDYLKVLKEYAYYDRATESWKLHPIVEKRIANQATTKLQEQIKQLTEEYKELDAIPKKSLFDTGSDEVEALKLRVADLTLLAEPELKRMREEYRKYGDLIKEKECNYELKWPT